jgi:hypothetical protein
MIFGQHSLISVLPSSFMATSASGSFTTTTSSSPLIALKLANYGNLMNFSTAQPLY